MGEGAVVTWREVTAAGGARRGSEDSRSAMLFLPFLPLSAGLPVFRFSAGLPFSSALLLVVSDDFFAGTSSVTDFSTSFGSSSSMSYKSDGSGVLDGEASIDSSELGSALASISAANSAAAVADSSILSFASFDFALLFNFIANTII